VGTLEEPIDASTSSWSAEVALTALYAAHWRSLVRLAWLLVRDQQAAEDVAQEAFVATYRRWGSVRSPEAALAYLRTCVVNGSRSALRHRGVRERYAAVEAGDGAPRTAMSAETSALRGWDRGEVMALIGSLPVRQREVLVLRYYLDLAESDIAATLGITRGSVKTHASRGISALRAQLGQQEDQEAGA
jgi:RNA polymerase sigma-70 factor (sigma-E family)